MYIIFQPIWKACILALLITISLLSYVAACSEGIEWKAHAKAIAMLAAALSLCIYAVF